MIAARIGLPDTAKLTVIRAVRPLQGGWRCGR
jgi:hypothetical protein